MTSVRHNDMQLAVRVPRALVRELDDLVPGLHRTRAEAVRAAVESYLYRLACERDAQRYDTTPLDDQELALADDPAAWSATPAW
jgi:Arc/MetJ-type ribon-helix-helix transcriptional regulator